MARAMATRCFCPPDSWLPREPQCVAYLPAHAQHQVKALPISTQPKVRWLGSCDWSKKGAAHESAGGQGMVPF